MRELAGFHDPGVEGLLSAAGAGAHMRVQQVLALAREADDVVSALAIRHRRVRHESFLAEATPVTVNPVPTVFVRLEVADIDDPKRTDRGERSRL